MSSSTQWTWTWANSRRQWRTGKSGVLQSIGSQRVRHDLRAEHQQQQINTCYLIFKGFPAGSAVENLPTNAGDFSSITGSERSPEEKNGCPSQYSCLGIPWTEEPGGPQSMVSQRKTCPSNWACMHLIFNKTWKTFKKAGKNMNSLSTDKAINPTRLKVTQILEASDWKLKITMSSEINQRKKFCIITYMWNLREKNLIDTKRLVVSRGGKRCYAKWVKGIERYKLLLIQQ